jgi:CRISPR-associated endonuclease Csn1
MLCFFIPAKSLAISTAKAIAPKEIDLNLDKKKNKITGSYDTKTASIDGVQIKDICIKLKIDRLGNISKV